MASAYEFLQSCFEHLQDANPDHSVSFALASNDWSETVMYAEGSCHLPKRAWGHALECRGTAYMSIDRYSVGFEWKPFNPSKAKPIDDLIVFFNQYKISIQVEGLTIVNPSFAPRYNIVGTDVWAGVLFGLEEVPEGVPDKEHYPKTLWSLSLQRRIIPVAVPK